jgi:hypothetical protein
MNAWIFISTPFMLYFLQLRQRDRCTFTDSKGTSVVIEEGPVVAYCKNTSRTIALRSREKVISFEHGSCTSFLCDMAAPMPSACASMNHSGRSSFVSVYIPNPTRLLLRDAPFEWSIHASQLPNVQFYGHRKTALWVHDKDKAWINWGQIPICYKMLRSRFTAVTCF